MKKKITESQLRNMISESVNRVLKESLNIGLYDRVDKVREYLGDDGFIEALLRCMYDDELEALLDFIEPQYGIKQFGEDDEL